MNTLRRFAGFFLMLAVCNFIVASCTKSSPEIDLSTKGSPYLFMFAGDLDEQDSDFVMMIDADPDSETVGQPLSSVPIGYKGSMPHHMEYVPPPSGEPIFMNGHHHELSMIVDISAPPAIAVKQTFAPPQPFRFPHDYTRTPSGTRLVGFLRSEGKSPDPSETLEPAGHGAIAEYAIDGTLLRTASAAVNGRDKAVRPYAFALLPEIDRLVVTSAPMMETSWADVVQIYRYSDFTLLHTLDLPAGQRADGSIIKGSQAAGFGPRLLADGSVFLNSYGCAFYHLDEIASDKPRLKLVYAIDTPPARSERHIRGACGIPVRVGNFWVQPVGYLNAAVVLDITDPDAPFEVFRLSTPDDFRPHWLAKDPLANRLVLGAELGGEQGFFVLRMNEKTGALGFDPAFNGKKSGRFFDRPHKGYISLSRNQWPHGKTGGAWGHAALFLSKGDMVSQK